MYPFRPDFVCLSSHVSLPSSSLLFTPIPVVNQEGCHDLEGGDPASPGVCTSVCAKHKAPPPPEAVSQPGSFAPLLAAHARAPRPAPHHLPELLLGGPSAVPNPRARHFIRAHLCGDARPSAQRSPGALGAAARSLCPGGGRAPARPPTMDPIPLQR